MPQQGFWTRKRGFFLVAILAVGGLIYFGRGWFGGAQQPQGEFGIPVETALVEPHTLDVTIDAVGTLSANEMVTLKPEIAGRIVDINFTEGQPVKKGAVLFKIDDRMARAELKQAESNLKLARLNYDRFRKLSATGAATKLRYDEAQAELGVNQANADLARTKVDYSTINAPFDGVVGLRKVSPGEYVEVGQELANFVSYNPMKVDFTIPETQASKLHTDQAIDITVEALPGRTFSGFVYALDPQLDVEGRAVSLRATIPNPDYVLKPGYFARVSLTIARKENALSILESAIVPQGDTTQVYIVNAQNQAALVPVTLGERLAGQVEVIEGLQPGDVVITSGQIKLHPGAKVTDLRTAQGQGAPPSAPAAEPASPASQEIPANEQVAPPSEALPADEGAVQAPLPEETPADEAPAKSAQ